MNNQEEKKPKYSEKYWEKEGFYQEEDEKVRHGYLKNIDKANYDN